MGNINHIKQHTMLSNFLLKFDQKLKSYLPTTFQNVKYNQTQLLTMHDP